MASRLDSRFIAKEESGVLCGGKNDWQENVVRKSKKIVLAKFQ